MKERLEIIENIIKKVAVCGGAGPDDFLFTSASMGADAIVTGEIKHHIFLAAKEIGIKVGDEVLFPADAVTKVKIHGEEVSLIRQSDVLAVID